MSTAASVQTLRRELAAALRLAEKFGYSEGICNHFSVVVPGPAERYLINPYGLHWSEMRPEHLVMIDGNGRIIEGQGEVEPTARNIHIAGHRANPRHACILHVHMPNATALTMLQGGRLVMAHQTAARFHQRIVYVPFGGIALEAAEGERIAKGQATDPHADVAMLEHHGVSVGGPSVAVAFDDLYYLERACRQQILAQSTGQPLKEMSDVLTKETARQWMQVLVPQAEQHFTALMRIHGL
jgi:ribulose-5-phosphate 4-epimerase/fuculose-1-phosphate aldolase